MISPRVAALLFALETAALDMPNSSAISEGFTPWVIRFATFSAVVCSMLLVVQPTPSGVRDRLAWNG